MINCVPHKIFKELLETASVYVDRPVGINRECRLPCGHILPAGPSERRQTD